MHYIYLLSDFNENEVPMKLFHSFIATNNTYSKYFIYCPFSNFADVVLSLAI